jgi:hypothetical protein
MENLNVIDLTNLIEALIAVLVAVAMRYLIPWLKTKMSKDQEETLYTIVSIAVMAAEKLYGAKKGDDKLAYVERYLEARGVKVDTMRLKAYVNAAIKQMDQKQDGGVTIVEHINGVVELEEAIGEEDEEPQTEEVPEGV